LESGKGRHWKAKILSVGWNTPTVWQSRI